MIELPPYIWTGIFKVLEVLVVGLILGTFASRYQKRKEIELRVKADILLKRLDSLERVNKMNCKLYTTVAPSIKEQAILMEYVDIINLPFKKIECEYRGIISSQEEFDKYYHEITQMVAQERIHFDYDIDNIISEYTNYLTQIKMIMDAYWDTVDGDLGKVNLAFRIVGVALQNDFNRFYSKIDQSIAKQMRKISLSYKDQYFKRNFKRTHYRLSVRLEKHLGKDGLKGRISSYIYYEYLHRDHGASVLLGCIKEIILVLMYIYYSDMYNVDEIQDMAEDDRLELIRVVHSKFVSNYHA